MSTKKVRDVRPGVKQSQVPHLKLPRGIFKMIKYRIRSHFNGKQIKLQFTFFHWLFTVKPVPLL